MPLTHFWRKSFYPEEVRFGRKKLSRFDRNTYDISLRVRPTEVVGSCIRKKVTDIKVHGL